MHLRTVITATVTLLFPLLGIAQTTVEVITGHKDQGATVQFATQDLLVTSSIDKIIIWDVPTSTPVKEFTHAHPYPAISPDGQHLAFATQTNTIEVWDLTTLTRQLHIPANTVQSLVFAESGNQLYALTCTADYEVCTKITAYDLPTGTMRYAFNSQENVADLLPQQDELLVATADKILRLDPAGNVSQTIQVKNMNAIRLASLREPHAIAVYSDPEFIPSLNNKGTILTVDLRTGKAVAETTIRFLDFYRDVFLINKSIEATRAFIEQKAKADDLETWYNQPFGPGPIRGVLALHPQKKIGVEFSTHALSVFSLPNMVYLWQMGTNLIGNTLKTHGNYLVVANQNERYGVNNTVVVWDLLKLAPVWETNSELADIDTTHQLVYFKNKSNTGVEKIQVTPIEQWLPTDVTPASYDFFHFTCGPQNLIAANGIVFEMPTQQVTRFARTQEPGSGWYTSAWCSPTRFVTSENKINGYTVTVQDWKANKSRTLYKNGKQSAFLNELQVSPDGNTVAWTENATNLKVYNVTSGKVITEIKPAHTAGAVNFTFINETQLALVKDNQLSILNFRTGETARSIPLTEYIADVVYNYQLKKLFVLTGSGKVLLFNDDLSLNVTLLTASARQYWVYTPTGYYKGGRNCEQAVVVRTDSLTQYGSATKQNYFRPDKVIEHVNLAPANYRKIFSRVYGNTTQPAPTLTLQTNMRELPRYAAEGNLKLKIKCTGTGKKLLRVSSNDIPLFGEIGLPLPDTATINLKLFPGENYLRCQCTGDQGSSPPQSFRVYSAEAPKRGSIYYVGLAASHYADSSKNLKYPLKDIRDMTRTLRMLAAFQSTAFYCDTLFNNNLTDNTLQAIKKKLRKAESNDLVVVHYAGHGLLNENSDLFLATTRTDFTHVERGSIPYPEIAALLDSVQSMKRLLLIDACNSGESQNTIKLTTTKANVLARGEPRQLLTGNYFSEFVTEYYSQNVANTGSYILAATSKGNLAYESDVWGNGVFTYALMTGIKNRLTDTNQDGGISISELQAYVNQVVTRETNSEQKPSAKSENLINDFFIRQF